MNIFSKFLLVGSIIFYIPSTHAFDLFGTKSAKDKPPIENICTTVGGIKETCTLADANIALKDAIDSCNMSYDKFEKQVNKKGFWKSLIGIAGTFAGSVGVPISSGDMAVGLGGFAGAANALQMDVQNMVSTTMNTAVLGKVYSILEDGTQAFARASNADEKIAIAMTMGASCRYSAGKTQTEVLYKIAGAVEPSIDQKKLNNLQEELKKNSEALNDLKNLMERNYLPNTLQKNINQSVESNNDKSPP